MNKTASLKPGPDGTSVTIVTRDGKELKDRIYISKADVLYELADLVGDEIIKEEDSTEIARQAMQDFPNLPDSHYQDSEFTGFFKTGSLLREIFGMLVSGDTHIVLEITTPCGNPSHEAQMREIFGDILDVEGENFPKYSFGMTKDGKGAMLLIKNKKGSGYFATVVLYSKQAARDALAAYDHVHGADLAREQFLHQKIEESSLPEKKTEEDI